MNITVAQIHPQRIVDAFGNYQIGVAQALKGDGHKDDGRFMDLATDWSNDTAEVLSAIYLKTLVRQARHRGSNFIEFWGWPEVKYRDGDNHGMVASRVRFLHVVVVPNGRPN